MLGGLVRPANAFLDKTRFVADVGIAYFCFHHFVSSPYKQGAFSSGAPHRTKSIVKAGVALLFAVNRAKAASKLAHNSKDPLLHKLAGGLDAMTASFSTLGSKFKGGNFSSSDMSTLGNSFNSFDGAAKAGGLNIVDKSVPIPGT